MKRSGTGANTNAAIKTDLALASNVTIGVADGPDTNDSDLARDYINLCDPLNPSLCEARVRWGTTRAPGDVAVFPPPNISVQSNGNEFNYVLGILQATGGGGGSVLMTSKIPREPGVRRH
jgi:hypothetical protein